MMELEVLHLLIYAKDILQNVCKQKLGRNRRRNSKTMCLLSTIIFFFTALCGFVASKNIDDSMIDVWVVSGGRASLPCVPKPKRKGDQPVLVLWYRRFRSSLPIYSYDARLGDFSNGIRWSDKVTIGRRGYFVPSGTPALVLEPAHAHDEDIYICRIDYRVSTSTTTSVNLTVVVPPGPPVVIWEGREMVGAVGPLQENQMTELTCRSVGGRPAPSLTWWSQGRELPLLQHNSSLDPVTGMSVIEASLSVTAERELQGGSLTCYARAPTHPNASEEATILPRSASVSLNITLSPVEVRILEPEAVVATSGSTITIVCHALGSHPPADLSWWRGTRSLEPHVTHAIQDGGNITTATLTIVVTGEDNGATLTCRGSNPALPQEPLSDRRKLIVYYEPIVDLTLGRPLESENIKEEDDVYFECGIRSNPRFHHILWYHNGQEIFQDISGGVVISKQSLVIRNVSRSHSGSYSCVATNAQGRTHSNTFLLKVQHSPICAGTGSQERTKGAARGTEVKAKCQVEAEPSSNLIWSWVRKRTDGSEEILSPEKYTVEGLTSTLTVIPQRREDYGRLLCRATNNIGRQREPCSVNVVPAGPPDTPTNCSATPIISDDILPSLSVTCLEGFDGGLPQIFLLEVWQNGKVLANISSDFPEWVVSGMEAGKVVRLSIVGHNIRGQSDPVIMKVQTTSAQHRAASEKETDVEVTPIMDAALGVVGVILLLLLVGVVIVRKTYNCQRKSVTEKTLASSSGEGLDPDVVQSIKRLDVVPCVQEEHTKEESDPMFTYSEHRHLPINGGVPDETHQITVESIGDEDLVSCQISAVLFNSPRQRRSCDIDTQSLNLSQEQSEDSGVSESESDNEIKLLEEEKKLSFIPSPQGKSHPSYIALQLNTAIKSEDQVLSDRDSGSTHPSTFTDVSESGRTVSKKSHKWSPVGFSLRQIPFDVSSRNMIQRSLPGKIKRGPPYQEETTTPVEAIGLDSTPIGVLSPFTNESLIHAKEKNMCLLPQSESVSQSSEHPKKDPARILGISKSDIGVPVTLYKADNGELLLMPKKPSDYGDIGVQLSTAPIYTISTLPKATGKKSKSSLETRPKEKDYLHIEKDDRKLPKNFFNDKYTYTKHAEPRIYVPPIHPDVCRRESSV